MTSAFAHTHFYGGLNAPTNAVRSVARPPQPAPVDLLTLQNASRVIHDRLTKDSTIVPDLGDTLNSPSGQASASYSVYPHDSNRVPFQKRKYITVPEGLFAHCDLVNGVTHIGLMPEIERAWIAYDSKLFFWDYVDGRELSSYMEQKDVINDVCLVKPKKGLFIDEISSLLVVTTPLTIFLLGVSFSSPQKRGRAFRDLKLYATDMKVSTDVEMLSVVGTPEGRIFMCGAQDGCLYELHYQENESWFGKRIQLINHSIGGVQSLLPRFTAASVDDKILNLYVDKDRNCFYALTTKGISIYKPNGEKSVQYAQSLTNIFKTAQDKAPGHPALAAQTFSICSLHVVEPLESRTEIQFFALTTTGVRLYFGPTNHPGYSYGPPLSGTNRSVQLLHVRLPPSHLIHPDAHPLQDRPLMSLYSTSQISSQPPPRPFHINKVEKAIYYRGMTVAAHPGDKDNNDYLLGMTPDLTRIGTFGQITVPQQPATTMQYEPYRNNLGDSRPTLTEYASLISIPGETYALAKLPPASALSTLEEPTPAPINELATQFGEAPCQFMFFTNSGLTFLAKRRAVDILRAILEEYQTQNNAQQLYDFRDSFGRDQTCCMLLGLACGNTFLGFSDDTNSNTGAINTTNLDITSLAKQTFYELGDRPIWTERATYGTTDTQGTTIFSGRREGFALYLTRIIQPIWRAKLTKPRQKLSVSEDTIVTIQKNLFSLKDFLDKNPYLFNSSPSESTSRVPVAEQEAWRAEQSSVTELLSLLSRTIEALSFVLLLNDYMLGDLISQCDLEIQNLVSGQTFETLVTTQDGMTISRALVNIIIDQQIGQQISVDTISEILQHRCGSFCSTDDVMLYKAKENIRKAVESRNPLEKQDWLAESLRLFIKGARILEFDKLREICGDYQQLDYAKGAIELPLVCAQVLDPDGIGLEVWQASMPEADHRTEFAQKRLRCYDLVLDSLSIFEEKCATKISSSEFSVNSDPETVRSHAYELAFTSEDQFFHSTFYDWLVNRGLADDLLEMRPLFLEAHLKREPITVQKFQLLWQFYVKNGQPLRAAEVLGALAESTQFNLDLEARLEYLTLAVANAKSHPISATGRHETAIAFLTDLEEKLDVAQVQLEIYNILYPHIDDAPEVGERIKELSRKLFTMTDLYTLYATPFDLVDMKLLCLHVSEHRDENVVRPLWNQIFDEILQEEINPLTTADLILGKVVSLGKRFHPSESVFPLRFIATLLVRFTLANKNIVAYGWAPRILVQCGVPYTDIWDVFHDMYESQVPPFNDQANVQAISSDIAVLLSDWLKDVNRPQPLAGREFPVGRIDRAVDQYVVELEPSRTETKVLYESLKRNLRRNW